MPDIHKELGIALVLALVILMTGCRAKSTPATIHNTESQITESATNQAAVREPDKPKLGQTTIPITGAFGYTLGAKIPVDLLNENGMTKYIPVTNVPPFKEIQISALKDGTTFEITTWVDLNHFADVENALTLKYGPPADLRTQSEFRAWGVAALDDAKGRVLIWTNSGCSIELQILDGADDEHHPLTYCNKVLEERWFNDAADENKRRATNLAPKL